MPVRDLLNAASGASVAANYIEDVFSTWLYTGTGASQTITNGIDLSTKGGMTWIKSRSDATNNNLFDTTQGATKLLQSNTGAATVTDTVSLTAFNSTGFTLGTGSTSGSEVNVSSATYASWTFRKQPKFFDIVTYTGTGAVQNIAHSLGSTPGCIMIKETSATNNWAVYHKGVNGGTNPQNYYLVLNTTATQTSSSAWWNNTAPTSTQFTVGTNATVNASGQTYIAYIFADQAGGFGTAGTDNVISCGSITADSIGNATVNLGWEPQYIMLKSTSNVSDWYVGDVMRGLNLTSAMNYLRANGSNAEAAGGTPNPLINSTGFSFISGDLGPSRTYIYMAIRRPMKVPTDATTVFSPIATSAVLGTKLTTGFPIDLQMNALRGGWSVNTLFLDRLRGISTTSTQSGQYLVSSAINAEASATVSLFWDNTGYQEPSAVGNTPNVSWNFSRRPGFFDQVCYTGTGGSGQNVNHNLTVAPELIIIKRRDGVIQWDVWQASLGNGYTMPLNYGNASSLTGNTNYNSPYSTTTTFNVSFGTTNIISGTFVAYLFATCAGVSKVGSYTGNGTTQAIACGFTGGARFVMIKKTSATGDWYVYDTARGMTTLTDPYLLLNSTAAEAATLGSVTTTTGGFTVNASILAAINTNAATYIFLAIA